MERSDNRSLPLQLQGPDVAFSLGQCEKEIFPVSIEFNPREIVTMFLAAACMFPLAGAVYDLVSRKRIHPLYWFAWLFPLVPGPLGSAIGSLGVWRSFARWILQ